MAAPSTAPADFSVSGKTAIVTGGGSGIGLSFITLLLSRNCNVLVADLTLRPEAEALIAKHSSKDASPRAVFVETDVRSWPALEKMFDVALAEFGDFDIVCPGAGIYEPHWSNFWHPPGSAASRDSVDEGRYAVIDINVTHPVRATQLALSHWLHPRSATITPASSLHPKRVVHISSVAGQLPVFSNPVYGGTKHFISGFVRSLALLDGALGVRVNAVAPGVVKTPLWTENPDKLAYIDPERDGWATPEEVAEAMLRLLEEKDLPGGTVLEVGAGCTRPVAWANDPGPDRDPKKGMVLSSPRHSVEEVFQWLGVEGWGTVKRE